MDLLQSLEQEVERSIEQFGPEIILRLLEKWEKEEVSPPIEDNLTSLLRRYVSLKLLVHRTIKKQCYGVCGYFSETTTKRLEFMTREARVKYHTLKTQLENHTTFCNCHSCRIVKSQSVSHYF